MMWSISVHHPAKDDHFFIEGPLDLRVDYEGEDEVSRDRTYALARKLVHTLNERWDEAENKVVDRTLMELEGVVKKLSWGEW